MYDLRESAWMVDGLCHSGEHDPDLWFAEPSEVTKIKKATSICDQCPVKQTCLEYSKTIGAEYGVWGGQSVRRQSRRFMNLKHGQAIGVKYHYENHEPPCYDCFVYYSWNQRRNTDLKLWSEPDFDPIVVPVGPPTLRESCGTESGYDAHWRNFEESCADCKGARAFAKRLRNLKKTNQSAE